MSFAALMIAFSFGGCARSLATSYIHEDAHKVDRKFYAPFEATKAAFVKALEQHGWEVTKTAQPSVYEGVRYDSKGADQILMFAEKRGRTVTLLPEVQKLNIYLFSHKDFTDAEVRYYSQVNVYVKKVVSYKNDALVEEILHEASQVLMKDHFKQDE